MSGVSSPRRLRVVEVDPAGRWRMRLLVAGLWIASLVLVWLWLRATIAPQFGEVSRELAQAGADASLSVEALKRIGNDAPRAEIARRYPDLRHAVKSAAVHAGQAADIEHAR
mgnify:CR=1 FL=1